MRQVGAIYTQSHTVQTVYLRERTRSVESKVISKRARMDFAGLMNSAEILCILTS